MTPEVDVITQAAKASNSYGLEVVLAVATAAMLFFVIRWVIQHNQERELALMHLINTTIVNQTAAINSIREYLAAQNQWAREAVKRMQEEHQRHERLLETIALRSHSTTGGEG